MPNEVVGDGYRWTRPFCGESRVNEPTDEFGWRDAETALRTRLVASDGDGHGRRYELPPGIGASELANYVDGVVAGNST